MSDDQMYRLLEQHTKQDAENFETLRDDVADVKADVAALRDEVREIRDTQTSQKGFVGGVVFVVGALFAVIVALLTWWK